MSHVTTSGLGLQNGLQYCRGATLIRDRESRDYPGVTMAMLSWSGRAVSVSNLLHETQYIAYVATKDATDANIMMMCLLTVELFDWP